MGIQTGHRLTDSSQTGCWFHVESPSTVAMVSPIIIGTNNEETRCRRGQWTKDQDKTLYELVQILPKRGSRICWKDVYKSDTELCNNGNEIDCKFPTFEGRLLGLQSYKDRYKIIKRTLINREEEEGAEF